MLPPHGSLIVIVRADTVVCQRAQRPQHAHILRQKIIHVDPRHMVIYVGLLGYWSCHTEKIQMHGSCTMIGDISYHVGSLFGLTTEQIVMLIPCSCMSEVHGNIDTSPCRSNIQSWPTGNEGLAVPVGLAHASRAGASHPRSGGILPRSSVGQDGSPEYSRKRSEMLRQVTCMIIRLSSSSWPLKDTSLGWGDWGVILIVSHHYMPDSSPWPLKDTIITI